METLLNILKAMLIVIILIFVLQIFYTSQLQVVNFCLKKDGCWLEGNKPEVKVIEKKVLVYKECPKCNPCEKWTDLEAY